MIYRVIIKISYTVAYFDFDNIQEAGEFAKTALIHQTKSPDTEKGTYISIKVIKEGEDAEV